MLLAAQLSALVSGRRDGWDWPTLTGTLLLVVANLSVGRLSDEDYEASATHHYQVFPENGPWSFSDIGIVDFLYGNIQGISGIICLALLCLAAWQARPAEDAGPAEVKELHTTDA